MKNSKTTLFHLKSIAKFTILIIIIFFYTLTYVVKTTNIVLAENRTYFAKVLSEDVSIFKTETLTDALFTLPKSFFVELLSASENSYYCKYNDIYGYVKKEQVGVVSSEPQTPYLQDISFRVFVPSGANLRSSPTNDGAINLIYTIPFLDSNISYYGTISGEEAISKKGTTWYFCKYFTNNIAYTGYVYAPLCDSLTPIYENTEEVEFLNSDPIFEIDTTPVSTDPISNLTQTAQTLIIIAISLPCLLFIYLLFKPTMIAETNSSKPAKKKKQNKKKISRLKHSDYFEFGDDDFD